MAYTVQKLSKLSGVSVRTLHYYDEIGLLKPAYVAENGYRYYEEEQMLLLQQILFFREVEMPLKEILTLLDKDDFDQIKALKAHRSAFEADLKRRQSLLKTIDKTIRHLKGEMKMADAEFYQGFDATKQKEYEKYLVDYYGSEAEDHIFESKRQTAKWDQTEWGNVKEQGDQIYKSLVKAIEQKLDIESDEVQALIDQHYHLQNRFFDVSREIYLSFTQLYADHPDFKKFFDVYHQDLVPYIGKAMTVYAERNL